MSDATNVAEAKAQAISYLRLIREETFKIRYSLKNCKNSQKRKYLIDKLERCTKQRRKFIYVLKLAKQLI